jgi:hypothetical protein
MRQFRFPRWPGTSVLLLSWLAIGTTGCDLGTYESRREQAVTSIAGRARLAELLGTAVTIPDKANQSTGVSLTLPKAVGSTMAATAGLPGVVDGIVGVFNGGANSGGPMLLFGAVPVAEGPIEKVQATLDATYRALAPGTPVTTPDTGRPDLRRISIVGPQAFPNPADPNAAQNAGGISEIFILSTPQHFVILVFRAADANDTNHTFREAVEASIRTLKHDAPAAPAAAPGAPAAAPGAPMP